MDHPLSQISSIRHRLRRLGARQAHEERILRLWAQAKPQDSGSRPLESFMPKALRDDLPHLSAALSQLVRLQSEHPADDGSVRWLLALNNGQTVETVGLPRDGVCVSLTLSLALSLSLSLVKRDHLEFAARIALLKEYALQLA